MSRLPKLPGQLPPSTLILLGVLGFVLLAIPVMNWLNARNQPIEEIETIPSRTVAPKPLEALPIPFLVTQDPTPQTSPTSATTPSTAKPVAQPSLPNPFMALPGQNPAPTPKPVVKSAPTPKPVVKSAPTPKPVVKSAPTPAPKPVPIPTPKPVVRVSALQQFVIDNQLELTGVTLGSVRVAIINSSLGGMVLAQGDYVTGSTVRVSRVESNKVILAQGKETAVLRLRDGE